MNSGRAKLKTLSRLFLSTSTRKLNLLLNTYTTLVSFEIVHFQRNSCKVIANSITFLVRHHFYSWDSIGLIIAPKPTIANIIFIFKLTTVYYKYLFWMKQLARDSHMRNDFFLISLYFEAILFILRLINYM